MRNMKKEILLVGLFVVVVSAATFYLHSSEKRDLGDLMLKNIEALAAGESERVSCRGMGSVDCPINHDKVELVFEYNNLEAFY